MGTGFFYGAGILSGTQKGLGFERGSNETATFCFPGSTQHGLAPPL